MATATGEVRIGISGWRYEPWRGIFYPPGLAQRSELAFASRMLPTIEINGSFYSLQRPESYARVARRDAARLRLRAEGLALHHPHAEAAQRRRAARQLLRLGRAAPARKARADPVAVPAAARLRRRALRRVLLAAAARQPARRSPWRGATTSASPAASWLEIDRVRPLRHAVEIRHPSFVDPAFVALLRRHRIALVVADTAGRWPLLEDLTRRLRLPAPARRQGALRERLRRRGARSLGGAHRRLARRRPGRRTPAWRRREPGARAARRDVYCYFDNDVKVHAPYDAAHLAARLGVATGLAAGDRFVPPPGLAAPRARSPSFSRGAQRRCALSAARCQRRLTSSAASRSTAWCRRNRARRPRA